MRFFTVITAIVWGTFSYSQILPKPTVSRDILCGAGNAILTAESQIDNPDLVFDWYRYIEEEWVLQGTIEGPEGSAQFITPFIINDEIFATRIRIGEYTSDRQEVEVIVEYEATIKQAGRVELCVEALLEAETNIDEDSIVSYQWQLLVPKDEGEAVFEDIQSPTSKTSVLRTKEIGFYRVVITNTKGCQAISGEVEVTDDQVIHATPVGWGDHCYLLSNSKTHTVQMTSIYGREITSYLWEASSDGVSFAPLGTEQTVNVLKPDSITDKDTTFYRLTVSEQGCSVISDVVPINWSPIPEGAISHVDPVIGTNDFFFCEDDGPADRTLRATGPAGTSITWWRVLFIETTPLDFLRGGFRNFDFYDPENYHLLQEFEKIADGEEITLTKEQAGLIMATFTDPNTGCSGLSTNLIFANTAFSFPMIGPKLAYEGLTYGCSGDTLLFSSYDRAAHQYSWKRYDALLDEYIEVGNQVDFELPVQSATVGQFVLDVTTNGCSETSEPFSVNLLNAPGAEIIGLSEGEVNMCGNSDHAFLFGKEVEDATYQWLYSTNKEGPYGPAGGADTLTWYRAYAEGYYRFQVDSTCSSQSTPVFVSLDDNPEVADFDIKIEGRSVVCDGSDIELSSTYQSEEAQYFWFYTIDSTEFYYFENEVAGDISLPPATFGYSSLAGAEIYFMLGVIDNGCGSASDPFRVTVLPAPVAEIRNNRTNNDQDLILCNEGMAGVSLEAFEIGPSFISNLAYEWSKYNPSTASYEVLENEVAKVLNPTVPGAYRCTIYNQAGGCFSISNDLEIIDLSNQMQGDSSFCDGNTIQLSMLQLDDENKDLFAIQWYASVDGAEGPIPNATEPSLELGPEDEFYGPGLYLYTIQYGECIVYSDGFEIQKEAAIDAQIIGEDEVTICGDSDHALLTGQEVNDAQYQWLYSPDGSQPYLPAGGMDSLIYYQAASSGYYRFEVTKACSSHSDPVLVTINENADMEAFTATIEGKSIICEGTAVELMSVYKRDEAQYSWHYSLDSVHYYHLQDETESTIFMDSFIFGYGLTEEKKVYFKMAVSDDGCSAFSEPFELTMTPMLVAGIKNSITNDTEDVVLCNESIDDIELEAFELSANNTEQLHYQWSRFNTQMSTYELITNATAKTFKPSSPGRYQCSIYTADSVCVSVSNDLEIIEIPMEVVGDPQYCDGNTIELQVPLTLEESMESAKIQWYKIVGSSDPVAIPAANESTLLLEPGNEYYGSGAFYYTIEYLECELQSKVLELEKSNRSFNSIIIGGSTQTRGIPFEMIVMLDGEVSDSATFTWLPMDYVSYVETGRAVFNIPESYALDSIRIEVIAKSVSGCSSISALTISLEEADQMTFSRFITPNGDGLNDYFEITGLSLEEENSLKIFDSWGNPVFEHNNYFNKEAESQRLIQSISKEGVYYFVFDVEGKTSSGNFYISR